MGWRIAGDVTVVAISVVNVEPGWYRWCRRCLSHRRRTILRVRAQAGGIDREHSRRAASC